MKKYRIGLLVLISALSVNGYSQATYSAIVESDQVLSSTGSAVNFGDLINGQQVNLFHGVTDLSLQDISTAFGTNDLATLQSSLGTITWSPMVSSTFSTIEWWSGSFQTERVPISVGFRPIVVVMNAADVSSVSFGSEIGIIAGSSSIASSLDAVNYAFGAGNWDVILGTEGSIQLTTAVPEPTTYALLFGIFGLALVMWRRRK